MTATRKAKRAPRKPAAAPSYWNELVVTVAADAPILVAIDAHRRQWAAANSLETDKPGQARLHRAAIKRADRILFEIPADPAGWPTGPRARSLRVCGHAA
jgi:hypothetical protein